MKTASSARQHAYSVALALQAAVLVTTLWTSTGWAAATPEQKCQASKTKAVGKEAQCLAKQKAKEILGAVPNFVNCRTKFLADFTRAEVRAGPGGCPTEGDAAGIEARVAAAAAASAGALSGVRFVDNGDGTVTDHYTGLQWEKKTTTVGSGVNLADPHDVDNIYVWGNLAGCEFTGCPNGGVFTNFLGRLNNCTSSTGTDVTTAGFAGHCDWRLPTIQELLTIADPTVPGCGPPSFNVPCIDPIFGPTTPLISYWAVTARAGDPLVAWEVDFQDGSKGGAGKWATAYARAVRGGL